MYGPGGSYSVFAGKDGSRGLGLSSLKSEDAVPDWSTLGGKERGVLNDWYAFFSKVSLMFPRSSMISNMNIFIQRYNIVGKVSDLPANVASPTEKS